MATSHEWSHHGENKTPSHYIHEWSPHAQNKTYSHYSHEERLCGENKTCGHLRVMKSSWRDQDMWPLQSWMKSWREQHMATTVMKSWREQNMWPQQSWGPCTDNKIQKQTPHFSLFVSTFSSFSQSNVTHTQWCHPQTEWQPPHPHTECCHPYTESETVLSHQQSFAVFRLSDL